MVLVLVSMTVGAAATLRHFGMVTVLVLMAAGVAAILSLPAAIMAAGVAAKLEHLMGRMAGRVVVWEC